MAHTTTAGDLSVYRKDELRARSALWLTGNSTVSGMILIAIPKLYLFGELALRGRSASLAQMFTEEDFLLTGPHAPRPFRLIHGAKMATAYGEIKLAGVCFVLSDQFTYDVLRDIRPKALSTLIHEGAALVRIANDS